MSLLSKLIFLLGVFPALALAHNPAKEEWWPAPGGVFTGTGYTTTFSLNAAGNWVAYCGSFEGSKQVRETRFRVNTVTGTPDSDDVVMELYSVTAGHRPNASIEACSSVTSAISSSGWTEHTCFTATSSLTRSSLYCFVLKNAAAVPASNYWSVEIAQDGALGWEDGDLGTWITLTSTNSGSTWSVTNSPSPFVVEFTDNTVAGYAVETRNNPATAAAGDLVYSTREVGAYFTMPPGAGKCFRGVAANTATVGTPTGSMRFRIYNDETLVATTDSRAGASTNDGAWEKLYFDNKYCLPGGVAARVVLSETTQSDTSSNGYSMLTMNARNDATDRGTLVADGTWVWTVFDGSSWTQTNTKTPLITLILDGDDPDNSAAAGGSSGPRQNQPGSGGMQ